MSLNEGLIHVIEQQPELFSVEDRIDLIEKSSTWSSDPDELDGDAYRWLQTRENIYHAALKNISSKDSSKSASNAFEVRLGGSGTVAPTVSTKDHKAMLLNAIHRSFDNPPSSQTRNNSHN